MKRLFYLFSTLLILFSVLHGAIHVYEEFLLESDDFHSEICHSSEQSKETLPTEDICFESDPLVHLRVSPFVPEIIETRISFNTLLLTPLSVIDSTNFPKLFDSPFEQFQAGIILLRI